MGTIDLILFAAKSILKLGGNIQKVFVKNIKEKELLLPLPDIPKKSSFEKAMSSFAQTDVDFSENPRIKVLVDKFKSVDESLSPQEKKEIILLRQEIDLLKSYSNNKLKEGISEDDLKAILTVRQWENGESPHRSTLQILAGTILEISVDYFSENDKFLNKDTKEHKALKSFLKGIDDVKFSETNVRLLIPELFIEAVETIESHPGLITSGEVGEELIQKITANLAKDINDKMVASQGDLSIKNLGKVIFKSSLITASETILVHPESFLGIDDAGKAALISNLGSTLFNIIIDDQIGGGRLKLVFSQKSVDAILKSSLKTIGEHPDLLNINHEGIEKILTQTATELAAISDPIALNLFPEISRIIIEKTAGNLELIWPGDYNTPKNHLLITASKVFLETISQPDDNGWSPKLTKTQLIDISEKVMDEVLANPDWILTLDSITNKPLLHTAISSILSSMSDIPDKRLSKNGFKEIFKISIKNMALRQEFVQRLPGDATANKTIVSSVLEMIFKKTLNEDVDLKIHWVVAREQILTQIIDTIMKKVSVSAIEQNTINVINNLLDTELQKLTNGEPFSINQLLNKIETLQIS